MASQSSSTSTPSAHLHNTSNHDDPPAAVKGYVYLLSEINVAAYGKTKYFDLKVQTGQDEAVRLVCFSPEKRLQFHESEQKKQPLEITATQRSPKRLGNSLDEYTVAKKSKIRATKLDFSFNEVFSNRYHTIKKALEASVFETVDVKVKVITKSDEKQPILKEGKTKFKVDSIIADQTSSMKLVVWENCIDKIHAGKSYHIENCKVHIFDDSKYLSTNEKTKIKEIEDIEDINLNTPEIQECLVTASWIGLDVNRTSCCILCNKKLPLPKPEDEMITCTNCKITTLADTVQTKLICNLVLTINGKIASYTAFNDAIQSFLNNSACDTPLTTIEDKELKRLFLKAGPQKIILDKTSKIISQFLK